MLIVCPRCKITRRIEVAPDCPVCADSAADKKRLDNFISYQGCGGGPKIKLHTCKECGRRDYPRRNNKGNSANCRHCNKRIY